MPLEIILKPRGESINLCGWHPYDIPILKGGKIIFTSILLMKNEIRFLFLFCTISYNSDSFFALRKNN